MFDLIYISEKARNVIVLLAVMSIFGALFASSQSNEKWRKANSDLLSYEWGFYFGWLNLFFYTSLAAFIVFAVFYDEIDLLSTRNRILLLVLVSSLVGSSLGYGVVKRNRFSWIVLTLLTLNPIGWLINYVYGRRRWGYIQGGYRALLDLLFQRYLSLSRQARIFSSSTFLWLLLLLFSWDLFSLSDHFYEEGALLKIVLFPPTIVVVGYFVVTKLWR